MLDPSFEDLIKANDNKLEKDLDVDHGLLSILVANGVIERSHRTEIEVSQRLCCLLMK